LTSKPWQPLGLFADGKVEARVNAARYFGSSGIQIRKKIRRDNLSHLKLAIRSRPNKRKPSLPTPPSARGREGFSNIGYAQARVVSN